MRLITAEQYQNYVITFLERLYARGLTQSQIAIALNVSDRAVRKWEYFESAPSGVQFCNLRKLCRELGA